MPKARKVICRKCGKSTRIPNDLPLAGFGRSGVVCARTKKGKHCGGEFRLSRKRPL